MKYCAFCGKELADDAAFCMACGRPCSGAPYGNVANVQDEDNIIFTIIGFFIPILGVILYLYYMDKMPLRAKSAIKGTIISIIAGAALAVLFMIIYIIALLFLLL